MNQSKLYRREDSALYHAVKIAKAMKSRYSKVVQASNSTMSLREIMSLFKKIDSDTNTTQTKQKTKKKPSDGPEDRLQSAFTFYFNSKFGERAILHCCSLAGQGDMARRTKALLMGYWYGFPDYVVFIPKGAYYGLIIEFKIKPRKPSENQIETLRNLENNGYYTYVCYDIDDGIRILEWYMALPDAPADQAARQHALSRLQRATAIDVGDEDDASETGVWTPEGQRKEDKLQTAFTHVFRVLFGDRTIVHCCSLAGLDKTACTGRSKKLGYWVGWFDYMILMPRGGYGGLFIEFKIKPNTPTEKQLESIRLAIDNGYYAALVYDMDEALDVLDYYMSLPMTSASTRRQLLENNHKVVPRVQRSFELRNKAIDILEVYGR